MEQEVYMPQTELQSSKLEDIYADQRGSIPTEEQKTYLEIAKVSSKHALVLFVEGIFLVIFSIGTYFILHNGQVPLRLIQDTSVQLIIVCLPFTIVGGYLAYRAFRLRMKASSQIWAIRHLPREMTDGPSKL